MGKTNRKTPGRRVKIDILLKYVSFYVLYMCTYLHSLRSIFYHPVISLHLIARTNPLKNNTILIIINPPLLDAKKVIKQQCHSSASVHLRNYSPWMSPSSTRNARAWWNPTPSACLGDISPETPGRLWCTREAGILHGKRFLWSRLVSSVLWSLTSLSSIS